MKAIFVLFHSTYLIHHCGKISGQSEHFDFLDPLLVWVHPPIFGYYFFYCSILGILPVIVLKFGVNPKTLIFLGPPAGLGAPTHIWKLFFLLFDSGYPAHHCVKIWGVCVIHALHSKSSCSKKWSR